MRKELLEDRAHVAHRVDDGLARLAAAQPLDHGVAHRRPVLIPNLGVDGLVADDGQLAVLDGEVDQHAVAVSGLVHAQAHEDVARVGQRVTRRDVGLPG